MPRTTVSQKELEQLYAQSLTANTKLSNADFTVSGEYIKECPEESIYLTDSQSRLRIEIRTTKSNRDTQIFVEWPSLTKDGEFVTMEFTLFTQAAKHFEFCLKMLNDLRDAVYEVL